MPAYTVASLTGSNANILVGNLGTYFTTTLAPGTYTLINIIFGYDTTNNFYATVITLPALSPNPGGPKPIVQPAEGATLALATTSLQSSMNTIPYLENRLPFSIDLVEVSATNFTYFLVYIE